jgi:hypothetical protein
MDRLVTLVLVRSDGTTLGALPSFNATTPWWPDVAEVVERCRAIHGVDVTILRLIDAADFDPRGGMGGRVTYVAELHGAPPEATRPWSAPLPDDPLRARWARPGGPARDLAWADEQLIAAGRPRVRPAV